MPNALEVVGQLMMEMGDAAVRIDCRGDTIVVALPGLRDGLQILQRWPGGRGRRQATIRTIHQTLDGAGLALLVQVGSATIGKLGRGAKAGLASRILGFAPMEVRAGELLALRRAQPGRPTS